MSAFSYRDAADGDAAALSAFMRETWVATFGHLYAPEDLNAFLDEKYRPAVQRAEIADAPHTRYRLGFDTEGLAGYCMMGRLELPVEDDAGLELHRLYVHERVKGAGVAAALMDDCIAWAKAGGARTLYLSVWEENLRAQRFYRRYGFQDHGEWAFMVGRQADRDLIWKLPL